MAGFKKVVIWGHPLHSHTHSYIHDAFFKCFRYMGYDTYWFRGDELQDDFDFSQSLFLTEGQVDGKIPLRQDCKYILHNCNFSKYEPVRANCLNLQVYTNDVLAETFERINGYTFYDRAGRCLYQPWATDLLPDEINPADISMPRDRVVYWVGTIGEGVFGNAAEIKGFAEACLENNIPFYQQVLVDDDEHKRLIQASYLAPQISGTWQLEKGYIPCRIFKNISYGQYGLTNSRKVHEIFGGETIYNPDTYQLFYDAEKNKQKQDLEHLMKAVREEHTYVNRINMLLNFL